MPGRHLVFVYGTLKRSFPNHGYLDGQRFIGEARTVEAWPLIVQGRYFSPVVLPEPGVGHRVGGEIWEVDDACLTRLDELESIGKPTGYTRDQVKVVLTNGDIVEAGIYFKARDRVTIPHTGYLTDYRDCRYVASEDRE
ncbi:MAG TPA: gamma-glutamylcyclotransferase [Hyphomicrobiaceae bacterium]|nr:gamma-glutamylcyclotransferase [Hyphomicrobiaceae bacterium]